MFDERPFPDTNPGLCVFGGRGVLRGKLGPLKVHRGWGGGSPGVPGSEAPRKLTGL